MTTRTKTALQTQIDTLVPDNTNREITPADVRSFNTDINDTIHNPQDDVTFDGNIIMSGTNTVDGRDVSADGSTLDAIVSNVTHTGDVTGATALTISDNAVTLAMMAHGTDGNLITYDATGAPAYVSTGSANEVLTSNGAGAAPTFQTAPAGQWDLLASVTASSSSSVTFDSYFTSSYEVYMVIGTGIGVSAAADFSCITLIGSSDPGGSNYEYRMSEIDTDGGGVNLDSNAAANILMGRDVSNGFKLNFQIHLFNPLSAATGKPIKYDVTYNRTTGSAWTRNEGHGVYRGAGTAYSGIRFILSTGNFASGEFRLYGLKLD